jgi:hypothetical protein
LIKGACSPSLYIYMPVYSELLVSSLVSFWSIKFLIFYKKKRNDGHISTWGITNPYPIYIIMHPYAFMFMNYGIRITCIQNIRPLARVYKLSFIKGWRMNKGLTLRPITIKRRKALRIIWFRWIAYSSNSCEHSLRKGHPTNK